MATGAIGFNSHQLDDVAYLVDGSMTVQGRDITIASGQTSALTPNHRIPPGTVVVKETGDGLYYLAAGADGASAGDINTAAIITSLEKPDSDWKDKTLTWTLYLPSGAVETGTVLLGNADDTIAEVVTALNADDNFSDRFVASDAGASDLLVITSRVKGAVSARMSMDLDTAYGTDAGSTSYTDGSGAEAEYRVTCDFAELKDINAVAQNYMVPALIAGKFRESALVSLSAEAKAVMLRRGSRFE